MMRVNLLQLVFGGLMLLSLASATDNPTKDINIVHHGSFQGVLTDAKLNLHDVLHMFTNRLASGTFLTEASATEATEDKENPVVNYPTIIKRKNNETGHFESATTTAPLSPTESMTVDTSTQTKAETTSDEPSTTISLTSSASTSVLTSTSNSIMGTTTGTSDNLASTSPTSTFSSNKWSTESTLTTKKSSSSTSTSHTTDAASASLSTSTFTSISTLPNGNLTTITSVTVVRVTPVGSSAGSTTSSTARSATTTTKHSTQKGVGALTTADLTREFIVMLGGAALAAMAL